MGRSEQEINRLARVASNGCSKLYNQIKKKLLQEESKDGSTRS